MLSQMYLTHFGLAEAPFSIAPNPRFVYLSARHQDALAHLLVGINAGAGGGFVALTGVVGSGKTTLCRLLLKDLPNDAALALILNPALKPRALIREILRELKVEVAEDAYTGALMQALNRELLRLHAAGRRVVVLIDEAQALPRESLEQLRLLTNLETDEQKLIQIVLVGQPELRELLKEPSLSNLDQRVTARYHLDALELAETRAYIAHRVAIAGVRRALFTTAAVRDIHRAARGVPRLINAIAERALMAAYARNQLQVGAAIARAAAAEVRGHSATRPQWWGLALLVTLLLTAALFALLQQTPRPLRTPVAAAASVAAPDPMGGLAPEFAWSELARLWGESDSLRFAFAQLRALERDPQACDNAISQRLRCLARSGSIAGLRALGRPVVLQIGSVQLLLLGIDQDHALIAAPGGARRVPLKTLLSGFAGRYYSVFAAPSAPDASWTQARIANWTAREFGGNPVVDATVRGFQRAHGLAVDGKVGPLTALLMSSYDPIGPKLQNLKDSGATKPDVAAAGRTEKI